MGERLLEPVRAEPLELARERERRLEVPARREVARHAPALVRVDHDLDLRHRLAYGLDHGQIEAPVLRVEPDLRRSHARVAQRLTASDTFVRRDELATRRVGADPVSLAPEEPPHRLVRRARDEIPDGNLDDPVAPVVQVDGLDDPVDGARVRRVDADEKPLEELAVGERVPARVALAAVVGADDCDRRVLVRPWHGIPGRCERRIERVAVAPRLDRRDPHHYSPE